MQNQFSLNLFSLALLLTGATSAQAQMQPQTANQMHLNPPVMTVSVPDSSLPPVTPQMSAAASLSAGMPNIPSLPGLSSENGTLKELEKIQRRQALAEANQKLKEASGPSVPPMYAPHGAFPGMPAVPMAGGTMPGIPPFNINSNTSGEFTVISTIVIAGVASAEVTNGAQVRTVEVGDKIGDGTVVKIKRGEVHVESWKQNKGKAGSKVLSHSVVTVLKPVAPSPAVADAASTGPGAQVMQTSDSSAIRSGGNIGPGAIIPNAAVMVQN